MASPAEILETLWLEAIADTALRSVTDPQVAEGIEWVSRCLANRAGVRLLMACMLAKMDNPTVDPREPYTEIGTPECFSGRMYDEGFIAPFITRHQLPCNSTTAFLTPALRNLDRPLRVETAPVGRPTRLYTDAFGVLHAVAESRVSARDVLRDVIRWLAIMLTESEQRMNALLDANRRSADDLPPSSEAIVTLLRQHLACKNSSRLPVLGIAAAYDAVTSVIGERAMPLNPHTSADRQSGAAGDVEICLQGDDNCVTVYEMKRKRVALSDIDRAVQKIAESNFHIDNYIFITSDGVDENVASYAEACYERIRATEVVILDYVGFLRHYLHFFHRYRLAFLDAYQALVLSQPNSAVPQSLKEAFIALRNALVTDEEIDEDNP